MARRCSRTARQGFATFENICYISRHGAEDFFFVLVRGFSAGVMHAVCAAVLGYGLAFVYRRGRMAFPGAFALLCVASTFHGIYNLLVAGEGGLRTAGYIMPLIVVAAILFVIGNGMHKIRV
ncbi:MAG: PrsW family intramembrane metalloprotease [Clostridiales Family XIII bacterium]|jgi:RsiW-degrading membrane proteinase PrsW (M82 family)|nr:PrsW family intramembrane metalloprotease [Clostridiales Family XIII bacterium]